VKASGGIEYANKAMNRFREEALHILDGFPESRYKESLIQLVQFTIERNN
jgi:octaprenyl-diphosphate synthase